METFPNVAAVRHEARRSGASVPGPYVCSLAPPIGAAQGLESPSCGKTMIYGRAGTTGLPLPRPPGVLVFLSPPGLSGVLGVFGTGRYLTVGR
jgi:hypothetical protein